jgi:2-polyprenyl-6-hydroxyphenyl methylase/3-demethylubiquinone-9 3-methyltransferase
LEAAPDGSYQELIVADICEYRGNGSYQLAICQSLLEHVKDTEQALQGIASLLASGGRAVIFVPCRNAWYARINMLLPERLKRAVLFALFPKARGRQGFPAYYNRCTPKEFIAMATLQGLVVAHVQSYYCSSYFSFFTPLHIFWRIVTLGLRRIYGDQVAETFVMVLDRPATSQSSLHEHFQVQ